MDAFTKYRNFINQYIKLNSIQWHIFKSKHKISYYKKGDIIHHIGDISSSLIFVSYGIARAYILDENEKDHTWSIFFNDKNSHMTNLFAVDYESFLHQTPSCLEIDVLQDCEVLSISYKDLQYLYSKSNAGDTFGRFMTEEAYSFLHKKTIQRQTQSAKQRFEEFTKNQSYLLDKVPQYHIATLLGITPQHLSRLKKNIILIPKNKKG